MSIAAWPLDLLADRREIQRVGQPPRDRRSRRDGRADQVDRTPVPHPTGEVPVGRGGRGAARKRRPRPVADATAATRQGDDGADLAEDVHHTGALRLPKSQS